MGLGFDLSKLPPEIAREAARAVGNVIWDRLSEAARSAWRDANENPAKLAAFLRKFADVVERGRG